MSYLVDTDVLSEPTRPRPDTAILAWLERNLPESYFSALTLGAIHYGIQRLPRGKRRDHLQVWFSELAGITQGRVLSVSASVAQVWGELRARWSAGGVTIPAIDGLIAATASRHGLVVVTRNDRHYAGSGVPTLNPSGSTAPR